MARYTVQIIRTICTIRSTQKNIAIDRRIKEIDLNQYNQTEVGRDRRNSAMLDDTIKADEVVKEKIIRMKSLKGEKEVRREVHVVPGEQVFSVREGR